MRATPGCELALTTDMLVEGRHFLRDAAPRALGHKASRSTCRISPRGRDAALVHAGDRPAVA
jgi:hypothetical protein